MVQIKAYFKILGIFEKEMKLYWRLELLRNLWPTLKEKLKHYFPPQIN